MPSEPELEDFRLRILSLVSHPLLAPHVREGVVHLGELPLPKIAELLREEAAFYLLTAAAGLNRTALKAGLTEPRATIVAPRLRKAFVVQERLPVSISLHLVQDRAVALRAGDLRRKKGGGIEALFRERLIAEGSPILMSPPVRKVPGLLVGGRKPDGVWPDPATGKAPLLYLELKNVRRVADDIQKRLYEIAEASLEMKSIYGSLRLVGLGLTSTFGVEGNSTLRARLRAQIVQATPKVVALLICPRALGERYREGAETFIDRVYFQEEIDDCLAFLKACVVE